MPIQINLNSARSKLVAIRREMIFLEPILALKEIKTLKIFALRKSMLM
jgi:hypothetical protein